MQYVLHIHMCICVYKYIFVDCVYMYMVCSCLIIVPVHAGTLTVLKSLFSHSQLRSNQIVLISTDCEFMCAPVVSLYL